MEELVLEIMKVALEKNRKNKNTVFVIFYGHVDGVEVHVYKNGWKENENPDFNVTIYSYKNKSEKLKQVLKYLKELED